MRNPWGSEGYDGPWNDKDARWTSEMKERLNHKTMNDGIFFMPIESFRVAFYGISLGMYQDWKDTVWKSNSPGAVQYRYFKSPVD